MDRTNNQESSISSFITGAITRLTVHGAVLLDREHSAAELKKEIEACLANPHNRVIVIDLGDASKLDAAGLGVLASGCLAAKTLGRRLFVENPSLLVRKLFQVCHLDELLVRGARLGNKEPSGEPQSAGDVPPSAEGGLS